MDFDHFKATWLSTNPQECWVRPTPELLEEYKQLNVQEVLADDVVFTLDDGLWQIGVATGSENSSQVEIEEADNNDSRMRYVNKNTIVGVFRLKVSLEKPAVEEPAVYKAPTGGLKIALNDVKLYIKVPVNTYPSAIAASSKTRPKDKKLNPGSYISDLHKLGMLRIKSDATDETWINPSENVVAPPPKPVEKLIPQKTRFNSYTAFDTPRRYTATSESMKKAKVANGYNFTNGTAFPIKYGRPVDIAGTVIEGEFQYGVPAKLHPDGTYEVFKGLGISMSYLVLSQVEYVPDEKIADVQPVLARKVPLSWRTIQLQELGNRFIDGYIKRK